uniref:Uncharacterized protein n=1 Tax=Tetraselmis chuii TaxID=63592 RepID=A0A7S1X4I9_9CHLO|eukprot:CAMPEP_0177795392 /NCGR_PEP_ID=MMETSP0491_2-20121128/26207_1 /TAXON_ID=63592 /ORGANISM="Tetraselmis chuii, Strain PLY429" /LENGTH=166 /DNA_ID=CAMNT_0019318217 /DNA_START=84 /DNA_END=584 /DNA_ORIENTATION=+
MKYMSSFTIHEVPPAEDRARRRRKGDGIATKEKLQMMPPEVQAGVSGRQSVTAPAGWTHRRQILLLHMATLPLCFGATLPCVPPDVLQIVFHPSLGGKLEPELEWPRKRPRDFRDYSKRPELDETAEERRKRVAGEVQREYERQQLQEELQTRNRALADAAWQSLE